MGVPNRYRQRTLKRLKIVVNAGQMASTESLALIDVYNLDSGSHVAGCTLGTMADLFRELGFEVDHTTGVVYTAPAQ